MTVDFLDNPSAADALADKTRGSPYHNNEGALPADRATIVNNLTSHAVSNTTVDVPVTQSCFGGDTGHQSTM